MEREKRPASQSYTTMSELVLPNDTNGLGNLMGGRLLHWMDVCAAISSQRHSGNVCVTASVDNVEFHAPIYQSDIVILSSQVNRAFNTSMEIEINVDAENPRTGEYRRCNRAFFTFVSVDDKGKPKQIPEVVPESDAERKRFKEALLRRDFRLFLSGRLNAQRVENIEDFLQSVKDAHAF